ncbi:MAG: double ATPase transporter [Rhodoglobus sp.]|jgi:ABC-type multidrug transport system fused ATPase/permease subunit|nr:double ATPase transporter [Rhodoglobus sp.]
MLASVRLSLGFLTSRERITYFALLAVRALTGVLDVFGILLIGLLAGIASSQLGDLNAPPITIAGFQLPKLDEQGLVVLVLFVLVVFALKAVIAIVLSRVMTRFIARAESENATKIASYILNGSLGEVQRFSKADVQFAVTTSSVYAFTGLLNNLATLVTEGFLLVLLGGTFIVVNPVAAIVVTAYFAGVIALIQFVIGRQLKKAGRDAVSGTIGATGTINDTIDTFREISVLSKQKTFIRRFAATRERLAQSDGTMTFLGGMPRYVVETSLILGVVLFVGVLFLSGQLATGLVTIGVFLTGGVRIMGSLLPLQNAVAQAKNNVEQAASAQQFLIAAREAARIEASAKAAPAPEVGFTADGALGVVLDSVDFTHPGNDQTTLSDISLAIPGGAHVAFIGPSGAGKTTLVDLLLGLVTPDTGSVTIGGVEPGLLRLVHPGLISYVPQKPGLVSGTIAENVALGVEPEDIDVERVAEVIEAAHLTDFIATLPDGLATSVGKQADALSGGQMQRLGLARALYTRPRLLILDEATSALDAGSEALVTASLDRLGAGVTVIIIAHRLSTVQHSDAVHVVEAGRITASGKFSALRKSVPMVAEYVKLMSFEDQ